LRIFETNRIDDQRVPLPSPEFLAEEGRVGVFCVLALRIDWNKTKIAIPVKERHFIGALQNLKWQAAGVMPRNAAGDAQTLRVNGGSRVMFPCSLAGGCERKL